MTKEPTYRIEACKVRQRRGIPHIGIFRDGEPRGIWQGSDAARALALVAELNAASPAGRLACEDALRAETIINLKG
jgi:hypothetical protein